LRWWRTLGEAGDGDWFAGAARREFDLLLVRPLNRFSREGMAATIAYLQRLNAHGVGFHSFIEEHLSTDNELVGNILLAILASLAKLEREKDQSTEESRS
jgi:DNA invertase Pin-like site-specific DNA recombinase